MDQHIQPQRLGWNNTPGGNWQKLGEAIPARPNEKCFANKNFLRLSHLTLTVVSEHLPNQTKAIAKPAGFQEFSGNSLYELSGTFLKNTGLFFSCHLPWLNWIALPRVSAIQDNWIKLNHRSTWTFSLCQNTSSPFKICCVFGCHCWPLMESEAKYQAGNIFALIQCS